MDDPARFVLTQWHKSFGLTVLLLSIMRLGWRFAHHPPADLLSIAAWQQRMAHIAHMLLYVALFSLPITGWILVSASPLNIDTLLFGVIPIPHIPPFSDLENKANIARFFHDIHEIAGNLLILMLLAHAGAALKHHFIDKDITLVRMLPRWSSRAFIGKLAALTALIAVTTVALGLYADSSRQAAVIAAGSSEVSFIAEVSGESTPGIFRQNTVTAVIDQTNLANSTLSAIVLTDSVTSDDPQVEGSLPDSEWFDSENFPEAVFQSTAFSANDDDTLTVNGELTIKTTTLPISFTMSFAEEANPDEQATDTQQVLRGKFDIDRRDYNIGMDSQADGDSVGFIVTVHFRFDVGDPT